MRQPRPRQGAEPPLFAWDLQPEIPARSRRGGDASEPRGACGVSDDRERAADDLRDALSKAPSGSHGVVRKVAVHPFGRIEYVDLRIEATARRVGRHIEWIDK